MSDTKVPKILLTQVEDALEERQRLERRQQHQGVPQDVPIDRRKEDRRSHRAK